jgi:hypothetical protein
VHQVHQLHKKTEKLENSTCKCEGALECLCGLEDYPNHYKLAQKFCWKQIRELWTRFTFALVKDNCSRSPRYLNLKGTLVTSRRFYTKVHFLVDRVCIWHPKPIHGITALLVDSAVKPYTARKQRSLGSVIAVQQLSWPTQRSGRSCWILSD